MLKKNDEKIGVVVSVGDSGEGIIKDEGYVIFVPFALPGETIKYKVLKVSKNIVFGKIIDVLEPSEFRTKPKCPVFTKCGGCQLQHLCYEQQLSVKKESVENAFRKVAFIEINAQKTVCGANSFRYRNKLQLPVSQSGEKVYIGFYAENSHRVIEIEDCPINAKWTKNLILAVKTYMSLYNLKGYNEITRKGDIREVTAREVDGNLIITLVTLKRNLPRIDKLIEIIEGNIGNNFSLYLNFNDKPTNQIYGKDFTLVYGEGEYKGEMLGIKYSMGVQSFMQVNSEVCEKLYSTVKSLLSTSENSVVVDAYSGAGLMTALLAKDVSKAIGIEIVEEAVQLADILAKENGLSQKVFNYNGKCEEIMPDIIAKEKQKNAEICLVLDPPRKGCDIKVIESIIKSDIDKIVYVSCKPTTLARDVGLLVGTLTFDNGQIKKAENPLARYKVETVIPFDMFPQTKHVETLVCLSHKKPDGHISVNVEFGEEEGQVFLKDIEKRALERAPRKKTTCEDIQSYIEEKYGFKVHTADIAEVKRDLGLPMYVAPNAVEELKRPRSHPTTEMVEAIKDALKHFEII